MFALAMALCAASCGAEPSPPNRAPATAVESRGSSDADAMQAAETTLRAFFAVKGRAEDPIGVLIDKQAVYLTARDVHPTVAYEDGMGGRPTGITDSDVRVELSDRRWSGGKIQIDFAFASTGTSYPIQGTNVQLDAGAPQESHWEGTATLEDRNGEWLIDDLTVDSSGGRVE
jgi:hypothetical protein